MLRKRLLLSIITLAFTLLLPASYGQADNKITKVKVGVHLLDVTEINIKKGTHSFDFYLSLWPENPKYKAHLELMNGITKRWEHADVSPSFRIARVKGEFSGIVDFRKYPFMNHSLLFTLEDKMLTEDKFRFIADQTKLYIDPGLDVPGWNVLGVEAETVIHKYPLFSEDFHQYRFKLNMSKSALASIVDDLLPLLLLVLAGFFSLWIAPTRLGEKNFIIMGVLLGTILRHMASKSNLPPLGYLTYLDKFVVINYISFVIILAINIGSFRLVNTLGEGIARKFNRRAAWITLIFWLILQYMVYHAK